MANTKLTNVHPNASIHESVVISPFVTIEEDVEIGEGCWIGPNAVIQNGTRMGKNCKVFPGAIVGGVSQDLKYKGEESILLIGDNVVIREYCTLNRGTQANYATKIGNNCLLMAYVHVAHDCVLGDYCILSNNVNLAGHISVGDYAIIGGLAAVHQFVQIGEHAFIGGGSLVRKDVPPYAKAARNPLSYVGVNSVGLRRRGFSTDQIHHIQDIYRLLFVRGLNHSNAVAEVREKVEDSVEKSRILEFLSQTERGVMRGFRAL